ncbi:hypothetical protein, variant 3 [Aphanomyces invadans]|uniref:Uncharacterized protein n=1 Tax=Aphanomyces invadans TaxID=157072 RepID=A0A024UL16_9STRA|nr:hypothetical protein H310_03002 [Aphanomyces invadans]XP_008864950.1 hypothetical protein, variant 3 [Aphanomyces invadans]ETW06870.1 hypothetical protein H310_03002 [Aphanomyces invadans]ETW06873.1 hypothetical protein, variant 3 [Aphanomyces invadans]|eukprot:XP_008864945.1 hypothetical protein H310_03002 [Aphanomyces invadans]
MEAIEQKLWLRRYKRFDPFYEALLRSPPSTLAMATGKLSIGSPTFSLAKVYATRELTRPITPTTVDIPGTIDALLGLQQPDGRWKLDAAFHHVMHNLVPPCPSGVGAAMWATACAVTTLRRQPDAFDKLERPCERGLAQVENQVFEWAKHELPSIPLDANLEARPVAGPSLQETMLRNQPPSTNDETIDDLYRAVAVQPAKKRSAKFEPDAVSARIVRQLDAASATAVAYGLKREFSPKVGTSNRHYQVGDWVECCWRRPLHASSAVQATRQDEWSRARIAHVYTEEQSAVDVVFQDNRKEHQRRVPLDCIRRPNSVKPSRSQVLRDLQARWVQEPLPLKDELQRLAKIAGRDNVRSPTWCELSRRSTSPKNSQTFRSCHTRSSLTLPTLEEPRALDTPGHSAQDSPSTVPMLPPSHAAAIEAILAYEKCLAKVPSVLQPCCHLYKTARLFGDRLHAFDAWMPVALELVEATATAVDLVYALERSIQHPSSHGNQTHSTYTPFLWFGRPFLTSVAHGLEMLAASAELIGTARTFILQ